MTTKIGSMWCSVCKQQTASSQQTANHLLHLVLTLLTFGSWMFVWIFLVFSPGPKRCNACGSTTRSHKAIHTIVYGSVAVILGIIALLLYFR